MAYLIILLSISLFITFSYLKYFATRLEEKSDIIIAGFTLFVFQIIVTQAILGILGFLNSVLVVSSNIAISLFILVCTSSKIEWKKLISSFYCKAIPIETVLAFQFILIAYGLIFFLSLLIPPYAWDSISYHLLAVAQWVKTERLTMIQPLRDTSYFPQNGSLVMLWAYITSKNMHILNLIQIPFAFIFALSTYSIAKKLNIKNPAVTIPIILFTPVVMLLCSVSYVDLMFGCFIVAGINFILGYSQTKKPLFVMLSCIALGLSAGMKPAGIIAIPIGLIFLIFSYNQKTSRNNIIIGGVLLFAAGGFWYIRNLILTGNPVFPYTIKLLGVKLFKGTIAVHSASDYSKWFVNTPLEWFLYPIKEKVRGEFAYSIENGFGVQFALGIVSLIYSIYLSVIKKDKQSLLIFMLFPVLIFFWLISNNCPVPRYIVFICSITAVATAYVYDDLNTWQKKIMGGLILYCLFFSFITSLPRLVPYQANISGEYFKTKKVSQYKYYKMIYGSIANAWEWMNDNAPDGSVIAYSHQELTTPLYGQRLQHDIVQVPAYKTLYKESFVAQSYEEWAAQLEKHGANYFFAWVPHWNKGAVHKDYFWAREHPEIFKKLKEWEGGVKYPIILYKVMD